MEKLPLVALVGRPNVGKSTIFNRLTRSNRAIMHDRPGVTRDRIYGEVHAKGSPPFALVDTGGFGLDDAGRTMRWEEGGTPVPALGLTAGLHGFEEEVYQQVRLAVAEAAVLVFVADGREGLTPLDSRILSSLRNAAKPIILAVNKVDGLEREAEALADFYALGLERMLAVSAAHGVHLGELVELIVETLPEDDDKDKNVGPGAEAQTEHALKLAFIGRPNAGKSSLVNTLIGEERMIVSELAGATRDSVDIAFDAPGKRLGVVSRYTIVDTAGMRRRTKIEDEVERYSVQAALKSARKADVAVMVVDAAAGVTQQDKKLISYLDREKLNFLIALNKMDLIPKAKQREVTNDLEAALNICPHAPVLHTSAHTGRAVEKILPTAETIYEEAGVRVSTGRLNRAMEEALQKHQPPVVKRVRAKFYYMTQADVRPPTFIFFVNDPDRVKDSYKKYLENQLRKRFGIRTAPIRVLFRGSHKQ